MKKIKIYKDGKLWRRIDGRFDSLRSRVRRTVKRIIRLFIIGFAFSFAIVIAHQVGASQSSVVYEFKETIRQVETKTGVPPVMKRIAECESNNSQHGDSGQVLINRTQDIGKYQIHIPVWGKKATEMGLDLSKEKDNEKFAMWLYENFGTEPWVYSKHCWN